MTREAWRRLAPALVRRATPVALSALLLVPGVLRAQTACVTSSVAVEPPNSWSPPLNRLITLDVWRTSVRDALDRLEKESGVRLSYSAESVNTERSVCLVLTAAPLGDALAQLLGDATIQPVIAGTDHVVLAPYLRPALRAEEAALTEVVSLEPVVVMGTAAAPEGPVPYARNVINGSKLELRGVNDLPAILSGTVPGLWAWVSSPADLNVRYASVRGASSFGTMYPKIYLDGIEVANPLVFSQLIPEAIEGIEVIRGPQGAALYGSDAISGVINIRTRHHDGDPSAPRLQLRTGTGLVSSDYARENVVSQDYVLTARGGTSDHSARLSIATGSTGEYLPDARSRYFAADGSGRLVRSDHILTGTLRLNFARAGAGDSPLIDSTPETPGSPPTRNPDGSRSSSAQYTLGTTLIYSPGSTFTHRVVFGVDGYRLSTQLGPGVRHLVAHPGFEVPVGGDRLSLRASTEWRAIDNEDIAATLGLGFEQSFLSEFAWVGSEGYPGNSTASERLSSAQTSSGLVTRLDTSLRDVLHLSAGLRIEANDDFGPGLGIQRLPLVGATLVQDWGNLTARFRTAYGKGVRPARTALREAYGPGLQMSAAATGLSPEKQSGVEAGVDLEFADRFSLAVTRFDQVAQNLVQAVSFTAAPSPSLVWNSESSYSLYNVGEISNRGWEAEAGAEFGRASFSANFSAVDSRVRRLAEGYSGDLRVGDRMLEVPARTAGMTGTWTADRASVTVTAYRAWNWINYDRERMQAELTSDLDSLDAAQLRDYWRKYDGMPRLNASASFEVRRGLSLLLAAENLFNRQRGEPDNITIVPGRTLTLGLRARF